MRRSANLSSIIGIAPEFSRSTCTALYAVIFSIFVHLAEINTQGPWQIAPTILLSPSFLHNPQTLIVNTQAIGTFKTTRNNKNVIFGIIESKPCLLQEYHIFPKRYYHQQMQQLLLRILEDVKRIYALRPKISRDTNVISF